MLIKLLIDHPYIGPAGTIVERSDKDARGMIGNKLAEALSAAPEVKNKKLQKNKVKGGTLRATTESLPTEASI
jgi:hypothetical protein